VRQNGTLYAHVVMVRSGLSAFPGDHAFESHDPEDESALWYHFFPDLVYARGTITRHLVPVARNRTMLLGDEASSNVSAAIDTATTETETEVTATASGPNATATTSETPAQWIVNAATGFGLSAMGSPNLFSAAGRYALVAIGAANVPGFIQTVQTAFVSEDGSLDHVIQLSSGPPVTHWKSRLDINLVQDFEMYSMAPNGATPGIFIEYSNRRETLLNRFYKIYMPDEDRRKAAPPRYAPWFEIDEFSLITKYVPFPCAGRCAEAEPMPHNSRHAAPDRSARKVPSAAVHRCIAEGSAAGDSPLRGVEDSVSGVLTRCWGWAVGGGGGIIWPNWSTACTCVRATCLLPPAGEEADGRVVIVAPAARVLRV
jgi:hypothetical protein